MTWMRYSNVQVLLQAPSALEITAQTQGSKGAPPEHWGRQVRRYGAVTESADVRCDSARRTGAVRACQKVLQPVQPCKCARGVHTTRSNDPIIHDASGGTPCRGPEHMHA